MSEADATPTEDKETQTPEEAAPVPMNRAERRALAAGKKGSSVGGRPGLPHQAGGHAAGHSGSAGGAQVRMHTRSSNRGK